MTKRAGYNDLNRINRSQGNVGEHPIVTQERALGFVQQHKKHTVLSIGYWMSKKGEFALTIGLVAGAQVLHSSSLDQIAAGMGALMAAQWLIEQSRHNRNGKCVDGVAYDPDALKTFENHPDATNGRW